MRKFVVNELKVANCKEIIAIAVLCLYALLKCLPNESAAVSKSGILQVIFTQTLSLNNAKMAVSALRIASLLPVRHENELRQIVSFIEAVVLYFNNERTQILAFRMLYEILINGQFNCRFLLSNNMKLLSKMMELLSSEFTSKDILTEVILILPIVAVKTKGTINEGTVITMKDRINAILESGLFDE
jgi:hypothetical protein